MAKCLPADPYVVLLWCSNEGRLTLMVTSSCSSLCAGEAGSLLALLYSCEMRSMYLCTKKHGNDLARLDPCHGSMMM